MVSVSDPNMMHLKGGTLEYFANNIAITKRTLVSPKKQRPRGRVTIAEEKNSYHEIRYNDLSSSAIWYKASELTAFKKHVIEKIRLFNNENMYDEETQDICGLMGHPSMKHRANAKERAIRHILKSQGMGAEILGLVARHATRSAKMIAYGQGIQDSYASKRSIEESSSSFGNKAAVADDDSNLCKRKRVNGISRSVRRRTESDSR